MTGWRLRIIAAALLPTIAIAADPLRLDLPPDVPAATEGDATILPTIVVNPMEGDFWYYLDRRRHRLSGQLPSLGTDMPRRKEMSERVLEALGLTGEGVQGLSHAEQQSLANFVEKLEGQ